jgi:ectoine hydroxylase-related dioxygenase (phytanoyl-CoA dioxygenase family)
MTLAANAYPLHQEPEFLGELVDSLELVDQPARLRERFLDDGYVFLRGLLDADLVLDARREILTKYAIIGEVDDRFPVMDAVAGDLNGVLSTNMRAFTESVRTGARYEAVILHDRILAAVGHLLDAPATPFDFRWPRLVRPGEGCGFHCDGPYMSRATTRHLSTWIPLGHVPPEQSALILLENSHKSAELQRDYLSRDADIDGLEWLDEDPAVVQELYGDRWLTTTFGPGDVLAFSMSTLHGALDNVSPNQCRLSTDSRYYAAGETPDPRWNGAVINPHGPGRVFYPGLGRWANADFQDEWKYVDDLGHLQIHQDGDGAPPVSEATADGKRP